MPSQLPGQITLPLRDELIERYKSSYSGRVPDGDREDPQVIADASVTADMMLPLYANQRVIGSNAVLEDATESAADQWGAREGVGARLAASGASGFVIIDASVGGATYSNGALLVNQDTGKQYKLVLQTTTQLFNDGDLATIVAVDTGPQTNVDGGKQLQWLSPPSGSGPTVTVFTNTDGSGLIDGRNDETDAQYVLRIRNEKADRSKMANDADYRRTAKETPGVRILEAFTYPCINGCGTTALACLLPPAQPGGSRIPSEAQRALIEAYVSSRMPVDDGCFFPVALEQNIDVSYQLAWSPDAAGWADVNPWPLYYGPAGSPGAIVVQSTTDATHFVLQALDLNYTGIRQPVIGQTIGFFDQAGGAFRKKRILTVSGAGPWTIIVDTANSASDTTYTPQVGQRAMPWSDSLPLLLPGVFSLFDGTGPGEMRSNFYDLGRRQRRQPQPPREWPNKLTTKALEEAIALDQVLDFNVAEGAGITAGIGVPGFTFYVMRLRWLSVFPI